MLSANRLTKSIFTNTLTTDQFTLYLYEGSTITVLQRNFPNSHRILSHKSSNGKLVIFTWTTVNFITSHLGSKQGCLNFILSGQVPQIHCSLKIFAASSYDLNKQLSYPFVKIGKIRLYPNKGIQLFLIHP